MSNLIGCDVACCYHLDNGRGILYIVMDMDVCMHIYDSQFLTMFKRMRLQRAICMSSGKNCGVRDRQTSGL